MEHVQEALKIATVVEKPAKSAHEYQASIFNRTNKTESMIINGLYSALDEIDFVHNSSRKALGDSLTQHIDTLRDIDEVKKYHRNPALDPAFILESFKKEFANIDFNPELTANEMPVSRKGQKEHSNDNGIVEFARPIPK